MLSQLEVLRTRVGIEQLQVIRKSLVKASRAVQSKTGFSR